MNNRVSLVLTVVLALGLASLATAQQQDPPKSSMNRVIQLLQNKGVFTESEVAEINEASTPAEREQRLMEFLLSKGLMNQNEYRAMVADTDPDSRTISSPQASLVPAVAHISVASPDPASAAGPQAPSAPPVIPAAAPLRVLQSGPTKAGGVIPALKLGAVSVQPYGFLKSTAVYDTVDQQNADFMLPGFLGDTGPAGSPEFHLKARAARFGASFEAPDIAGGSYTITGKIEADFEGDFTRSLNRNISSIRSSQLSLRLAYIRIDHKISDKTTIFGLFGQDWTPFASSTLPNLLDTTGLGIGFGSLYEREPQWRLGLWHNFGGSRNFTIGIEPAMVLPGFGNQSTDLGNQLGVSERQGTDSARPAWEARIVTQWQLDKAKGVAPAQIIFSGVRGWRRATVLASAVPAAFKATFPQGADVTSSRYGGTVEIQLPTRYATLIGKYWTGSDMRWYFEGQLFSNFNDPRQGITSDIAGLIPCTTSTCAGSAASIDGSSTVLFGYLGGIPVVVPQSPVRAAGGFAQLSFPLSRIFNADPMGRNAGWTLAFTYGIDQAKARDVRFLSGAGGNRLKSDMAVGTLTYKLNQYITFAYESSYYRTRAIGCSAASFTAGTCRTLFEGLPARSMHDWRNEIGPVFNF